MIGENNFNQPEKNKINLIKNEEKNMTVEKNLRNKNNNNNKKNIELKDGLI